MCSRFAVTSSPSSIKQLFDYQNPAEFPPRNIIAPTEPIMIVREAVWGKRELALVRWGLIPHWVKNPDDFTLIINARAETLLEKPSFRTALAHKRCLIPADHFYEWSGPKHNRQKHTIKEINNNTMAFAGLWDHWLGADGSEFESAAIITVAANKDIEIIHHRMPAVIENQDFADWLDVKNVTAKEALTLLKPAKNGLFNIKSHESNTTAQQTKRESEKSPGEQGELF